jgi:hypothetical protein
VKDKKIQLVLGTHAHVPSGASEKEFEYAYDNIMRPFISNLYRYSNIQAVIHYSGVLLYWVERNHPEFFMLIEDMVTRKQAEIIGGGFYEPMFPIIPHQDRLGQIEFLTTYLRRHFGKRPLGCWIPGMVWEQNIAASLSASDMQYTFLSQHQFSLAGLTGSELYYPCITEDQGKLITVFPVSLDTEKELKNKSFSHVFVELINKIKDDTNQDNTIISIFPKKIFSDPDESPDMAWNRFLEEISLSENIVETTLPSKILKNNKALKKASFPNSASIGNGINNGFSPRQYLIDHCEVNGIYSKMVFTNVLISQLKGDKSRKQNAREELWKAQDSCLYIPSSGYNSHTLRKAAYSSLLRAEQLTREKGKSISSLIQYDFDFDGNKEILIQDAKINCCIQLKGAGLFELDYLPKDWNYLDCGAISYGGLDTRRVSFADIFLPPETGVDNLNNNFLDNARLCFTEQYDALSQDRKGKSCFRLSAVAGGEDMDTPFGYIEINKCYSLKKDIVSVAYGLKNTAKEICNLCFVPEIDFSFAGEGDDYVRFYSLDAGGKDLHIKNQLDNASTLKILDVTNEVQILLGSTNSFSGCIIPICPNGEYQATRILPLFRISLEAGKSWINEFSLKISH